MQLPRPYFFTKHIEGFIDRPQIDPNEGPVTDKVDGYHTLWIAEVPFIPSLKNDSYQDFDFASANRLTSILKRQKRFLSDLAFSREYQTTFEMRLVSWPQHNRPTRVGLAFLGKVFHKDKQVSHNLSVLQWDKFSALFPKEAPFSYPLLPVQLENNNLYPQTHTFSQWYQPIPFEQLTHPASIVELRKYEDWPLREIVVTTRDRDYIPHPFEPTLDYSAFARLIETLASQRDTCIVSVTLRPQRLTEREVIILHDLLGWHQQIIHDNSDLTTQYTGLLGSINKYILKVYQRTRAKLGIRAYEHLVNEQHCLFTMRLQVIGSPVAQQDLVEALGSEVVANVDNDYPSLWSRVIPATEQEFHWARYNAQWLEFVRWGISPRVRQALDLTRLRQLASVNEAMGAFRLPIASADRLAGMEIRDEPFPLATSTYTNEPGLTIGTILDRGMQTGISFSLPLEALHGFIPLLGDNSTSRKAVLRSLLQGVHAEGIPCILICNPGPETTDLVNDLSAHRIVPAAQTTTQAQSIQLFAPPPGIPLPTFIDALVRVVVSTCQLELSFASLLRKALIDLYTLHEEQLHGQITMVDLLAGLENTLQHTSSSDTPVDVLYKCIIPLLQDLATTADTIFTMLPTADDRWTAPIVIEIGLIGNDLFLALLRSYLWAWFSLALTTREDAQCLQGIVAVEDAHTIFGTLSQTPALSVSPVVRETKRIKYPFYRRACRES